MKQFLITLAGVFVGLLLFLVVVPIVLISAAASSVAADAAPVPASTVLELDLREPLRDQPVAGFLAFGGEPSVIEVTRTLDAASRDERVKGLLIRAGGGMMPAHAEEIRQAVERFKASGRFVTAHVQGYFDTGLTGYYAIANADEIWIQPGGPFFASGVRMENLFARELLDDISVSADFEALEEYKNAPNTLTERGFTPAHREAEQGLVNALYASMTAAIGVDREKTPEQVRTALEAGPYNAQEAVEAGFIDRVGMPEEMVDAAFERTGTEDSVVVSFWDYAPPPANTDGPVVAVVGGEGGIMEGRGEAGPFGDSDGIFSDTMAEAILAAIEDEDVRAIVLRVDSGGGSALASDQIWAALERAQAANKPVVVSMSGLAASGGYFIAAGANEIVAQPGTITGSIGVFAGKLVTEGGLERVGLNTESVQAGGAFTGAFSSERRFTDTERAEIRQSIRETYDLFLQRVADGRGKTVEEVRTIARGRVWTGAQAKALGLVDHLGGLDFALRRAAALANLPADEAPAVRFFPEAEDTFAQFRRAFGVSTEAMRAMAVLGALAGDDTVERLIAARSAAAREGVSAEMAPVTVR